MPPSFLSIMLRLLFLLVLDIYTYQAVKTAFPDKTWLKITYWAVHFLVYLAMGLFMEFGSRGADAKLSYVFWFFSAIIALYVPKLLISTILLFEDGGRLIRWILSKLQTTPIDADPVAAISRSKFLNRIALLAGAVPFAAILNGMIRTKYNYQVNRIKVPIKDLPADFEGFTITQISDLHTGSYDNKEAMSRGIDLVNDQKSDVIVFTGDLVNFSLKEVEGFEEVYKKLTAKEGVFSVLGNHDYYGIKDRNFSDKSLPYFEQLRNIHKSYNWNLLMNQNALIQRGDSTLAIIGVENQGKGPYFPREGDLKKAAEGTENAAVRVLLSHDPTHWREEVLKAFTDIDLTLSGHTHGFQFGIEIPGFKWSPAKLMYPEWAGLYQEARQFLYVNRGFGFLGFSGRVGIRPEITVLELVRA